MQSFTINARLGQDPEFRRLATGNCVVNASVAINNGYFNKDKEWVDKVLWMPITIWGEPAERFAAKFRKGDLLFLNGKLDEDSWEDKATGERRTKIVFKPFEFCRTAPGKASREEGDNGDPVEDGDGPKVVAGPDGKPVNLGF